MGFTSDNSSCRYVLPLFLIGASIFISFALLICLGGGDGESGAIDALGGPYDYASFERMTIIGTLESIDTDSKTIRIKIEGGDIPLATSAKLTIDSSISKRSGHLVGQKVEVVVCSNGDGSTFHVKSIAAA